MKVLAAMVGLRFAISSNMVTLCVISLCFSANFDVLPGKQTELQAVDV